MKLHLQRAGEQHLISAYAPGSITVNETRYERSLVVAPDWLIPDWGPRDLSDLETDHFAEILTHQPEILLLGTGKNLRFPAPELLKPFPARQIGVEVMDTAAACRTYNILMGENRQVAAALIML